MSSTVYTVESTKPRAMTMETAFSYTPKHHKTFFFIKLMLFLLAIASLHSLLFIAPVEFIFAGMEYYRKFNNGKLKCSHHSDGSQAVSKLLAKTSLHHHMAAGKQALLGACDSKHAKFESVVVDYVKQLH